VFEAVRTSGGTEQIRVLIADLWQQLNAPMLKRNPPVLKYTLNHPGGVQRMRFSPDGKTLATSDGDTPRLWNVASGVSRD
jgi:hypothetical protein